MVTDHWHVSEIPQKLNSQEKIQRWDDYIPKGAVTGKLLVTEHECEYQWTGAVGKG